MNFPCVISLFTLMALLCHTIRFSGPIGKTPCFCYRHGYQSKLHPNRCWPSTGEAALTKSLKISQLINTMAIKMVCTIRDGVLPARLALLEIGPINHSRWLTTANRLLRLWVAKHGLKGKLLKNLQFIVEFIIGVYYPCWFNVKVKHSWTEGPRHILFQLDCLKSQRKEVLDLVIADCENICLVCPQ